MKPKIVKELLVSQIKRVAANARFFCNNAEKDFTRKRKLTMEKLLTGIIGMGSGNLSNELTDMFNGSKAMLRRMHELNLEDMSGHLIMGNLDININAFTVRLNGELVPCTPKETEILWTLASNPGMVFSREHLLQNIWGYDFLGDTRAVDSHIKRIRAKLCHDNNDWDIKTVWGVGYRFEVLDGRLQ